MSDPRALDGDLEVAARSTAETVDDSGDDSGSSDQVPGETADVGLRRAPGWLAEAVTQAADDAGSPLGPDAPALDPSTAAGLDAQLGASAEFEAWSARAADPGFGLSPGMDGLSQGMDGLPDPGGRLGGLESGLESGFASRPDLGISRDPGSLLGGTGQSNEDLLLSMQRPDSGPNSGGGGGMSDYAFGLDLPKVFDQLKPTLEAAVKAYVDAPPSEGGPPASLDEKLGPEVPEDPSSGTSATPPAASPEVPAATPPAEEPPAEDPPADPAPDPPADPKLPDEEVLTTGEDSPVFQDPGNRPLKAGPDYGQGDPGDSGDTSGGSGGGSGGEPLVDGTKPQPMTTGEGEPVLQDPSLRNPTAGPDYGPGIPGESGAAFSGIASSATDEGIIVVDSGRQAPGTSRLAGLGIAPDAGGAQAPAVQQVTTSLGGVGAVGAAGAAGAAGTTGTTGEGGGSEPGGIGSSSFAMSAETDQAAGTEGTGTSDDPTASPADGVTAGMVSSPDPGTGPLGRDPGLGAGTDDDLVADIRGDLPSSVVDEGIIIGDTGRTAPGFGDIRPGKTISITGIDDPFSGNAFVTGERHDIGAATWATGDEIFGSWSTTDQPGVADSPPTASKGDAAASMSEMPVGLDPRTMSEDKNWGDRQVPGSVDPAGSAPDEGIIFVDTGEAAGTLGLAGSSDAGAFAGKDPSTISGSEDEDLEDLEVQRRTVRGGDTESTTGSATDEAIIIPDFGHQDPRTVGLAGSATDEAIIIPDFDRQAPRTVGLEGSAAGTSAGTSAAGDPSTISGSEDDDLEDLEVQRRPPPPGTTEATMVSAAGAGDDFVGGSIGGPPIDPAVADDFSTSIMGGLDVPVETSSPADAPAASVDIAAVDLAVAEAALPPMETDEWKLRPVANGDAPAGDLDLSVQEAAFEVAPMAIEDPQMDQPVVEQLDPGLGDQEPPPDASDMGEVDIPLP